MLCPLFINSSIPQCMHQAKVFCGEGMSLLLPSVLVDTAQRFAGCALNRYLHIDIDSLHVDDVDYEGSSGDNGNVTDDCGALRVNTPVWRNFTTLVFHDSCRFCHSWFRSGSGYIQTLVSIMLRMS